MPIMQHKPNSIDHALQAMHKTICKLAHQYTRTNKQNFDDVYQNGCIGLAEAYNNFNPNAGRAFSSHAYQWIHANIRHPNSTQFNYLNSTVTKSQMEDDAYVMDLDAQIDFDRQMEKLDSMTRGIVRARAEGYTFQQIADVVTSMGQPSTLHQIRNRYEDAIKG